MTTKKPEPRPKVRLSGTDGNAYALIGRVREALRKAGASKAHIDAFQAEAMAGDYDNLLRACMKYADVS